MIFNRDILRADYLFRRDRKKRARFHGCVIRDNHYAASGNLRQPRDGSSRRSAAPFFVHFVRGIESQLEKLGLRVDQLGDALASRQPALFMLRLDGFRASALPDALFLIFYFRQLVDHLPAAFLKVGRFRVDTRIVFRAAQRVLSYTPAALASSVPNGNTASDCTIRTYFLTSRTNALESARFETTS